MKDNKELVILAGKGGGGGGGSEHGIPSGGSAGQLLGKASSTDYDASWVDNNTFKVTFTFSYDPPDYELSISCDKTLEEISAAYASGKLVYAINGENTFLLEVIDTEDGTCTFTAINDEHVVSVYMPVGSDEWQYSDYHVEKRPDTVQSSNTSITVAVSVNTKYKYGTLTALTISSVPAIGDFMIIFTSGSTATVLTVPNDLHMPDGFAVEANMRYEINVSDGYAACMGWSTT